MPSSMRHKPPNLDDQWDSGEEDPEVPMEPTLVIIPSRVSGLLYKIGPVCLFVCLSVRLSVLSRLNHLSYGPKIWQGHCL